MHYYIHSIIMKITNRKSRTQGWQNQKNVRKYMTLDGKKEEKKSLE